MGILTSKEEIKEIENVAQVFLIEERVKDLTSHVETKDSIGKAYSDLQKATYNNIVNRDVHILMVRGLN